MTAVAVAMAAEPQESLVERVMRSPNLPKQDLNALVMDFLIKEGYPSAAKEFSKEANLDVGKDDSHILERVAIREAIYRGDIEKAVHEINAIAPDLFDNDKPLHFSLLRLQLIELIKGVFKAPENDRPGLVGKAIYFAQQNLAPYAPLNDQFKNDLERAMALLIVPQTAWQGSSSDLSQTTVFGPLAELVSPALREEVASNVNAAVLKSYEKPHYSKIKNILQTRAWAEELARQQNLDIPPDFVIQLDASKPGGSNNGDHGADTAMTEDDSSASPSDPVRSFTTL